MHAHACLCTHAWAHIRHVSPAERQKVLSMHTSANHSALQPLPEFAPKAHFARSAFPGVGDEEENKPSSLKMHRSLHREGKGGDAKHLYLFLLSVCQAGSPRAPAAPSGDLRSPRQPAAAEELGLGSAGLLPLQE